MIWDERDQWNMRRIIAEVWVTLRMAHPWPLHTHPLPGHSSAPLGLHVPVPVIRSWLAPGVRPPTPTPHTHSLTEGLTPWLHPPYLPPR